MKYSLRSLMIVVAVVPPILAGAYYVCTTLDVLYFAGPAAIVVGLVTVAFLMAAIFGFPAGSIRK